MAPAGSLEEADAMSFGALLKDWRMRRRASQLDLALGAEVSARHVSFLETGRSRPSRAMVLRLAAELDVPLGARDEWLLAAGLAPAHARRNPDQAEGRMAHEAVAWMVDRHDPYPALAVDRHWRVLRANDAARRLLGGVGLGAGDSLLEAFLSPGPPRGAIVNWDEVAAHLRVRLAAEDRHYGGDPVLAGAVARLDAERERPNAAHEVSEPEGAFLPVRYRVGGAELSLFSTLAQFHTAHDVALSEMRVELMFPADEASRAILLAPPAASVVDGGRRP